jgi:hypothetical protein
MCVCSSKVQLSEVAGEDARLAGEGRSRTREKRLEKSAVAGRWWMVDGGWWILDWICPDLRRRDRVEKQAEGFERQCNVSAEEGSPSLTGAGRFSAEWRKIDGLDR